MKSFDVVEMGKYSLIANVYFCKKVKQSYDLEALLF